MDQLKTILFLFATSLIMVQDIHAQNRINKELFLITISRIPNEKELESILATCQSSEEKCLAKWIIQEERFKLNLYAWLAEDFLEGVSDGEIMASIMDAEQIVYGARNTDRYEEVKLDYEQWKSLKSTKNDLKKGNLSYQNLIKRMIDNPRFDEINMGADNFVNKTFYLLLNRYPTSFERTNGVNMVEGSSSILFLKRGGSKTDYLNILTSNDSYVEYQLAYWHEKLSLGQPTKDEQSSYLRQLKSTGCFSLDCMLNVVLENLVIKS